MDHCASTRAAADLLLVDDDPVSLSLLKSPLTTAGFGVRTADSERSAISKALQSRPDAVITDLHPRQIDGLHLMDELVRHWPGLAIIIATSHGSIASAVEATQRGVVAYLTKPVHHDQLLAQVRCALELAGVTPEDNVWNRTFIGCSAALKEIIANANRAARNTSNVLVLGPSGSGKELLAGAIHVASRRPGRFVPVNCSAIPVDLLESELFGHVRGAFTGAIEDRAGLFEEARAGTLFLDEIGDMPMSVQIKLLRVLQERCIRPVGSNCTLPVDVRIVSATHRDLRREMDAGRFREDLYYRLNVVELSMPGLNERRDDIPALVAHKLQSVDHRASGKLSFSPPAMQLLLMAQWHGNVRELFNVVERCAALATSRVIGARSVRASIGDRLMEIPSYKLAREEFTNRYLSTLLALSGGRVSRAARLAKRSRTDFYRLLARHRIDVASFK